MPKKKHAPFSTAASLADGKRLSLTFAGVGSRSTPQDVLHLMSNVARILTNRGALLRTGGSHGADDAFLKGVSDLTRAELYIPWSSFNGHYPHKTLTPFPRVYVPPVNDLDVDQVMDATHTWWRQQGAAALGLLRRNVYIITGPHGPNRGIDVDFVLCWTENGRIRGGTGHTIRVATHLGIPVYNLGHKSTLAEVQEWSEQADKEVP